MRAAKHYCTVSAKAGFVRKVILNDGGDHTSYRCQHWGATRPAGTLQGLFSNRGGRDGDYAVTVVLDFVNPVGAGGRFRSFDRLSRDNEPGRKRLVFHSAEKIGRRIAGNNEPGVVFSRGLQLSGFWKKARMARPQTISMVPETLQDGDGPGLDDWG